LFKTAVTMSCSSTVVDGGVKGRNSGGER